MAKKNKVLSRIEERIFPYREFWFEWIHSPGCYLNKSQVDAILLYQHYKDIKILGEKLGRSSQGAYALLNGGLIRLLHSSCGRQYREWIAEGMLEQAGAYDNFTPLEKFLSTPMRCFNIPSKYRYSFMICGDTFGELLNEYGEKDLLRLRNFGSKKLQFLKGFLKQNECLHLLKKQHRTEQEELELLSDSDFV